MDDDTDITEFVEHERHRVAGPGRSALDQLPARQRQTIILSYFLDLSVADTADVMRCTPGTVKATTSQALRHLSNQLAHLEVLDA